MNNYNRKPSIFDKSLNKYIAETKLLQRSGYFIRPYGDRVFIIGGSTALAVSQEQLISGLQKKGIDFKIRNFFGVCSYNEINQIGEEVKNYEPDLIIGIGGGKALDTSKAVAFFQNLPVITIPTIASTCAAWAPTSVIYSEKGVPSSGLKTLAPEYVLVDLDIIRSSPSRYFAAGLADSLAKWPELGLARLTKDKNCFYSAGIELCRFVRDRCLSLSSNMDWYTDSKEKLNSKLDEMVDVCIPLTGLCSELTAGAMTRGDLPGLAHAVDEALLALADKSHNFCHGERIAFGLPIHMQIFKPDDELVSRIISFSLDLDLPIELEDHGMDKSFINDLAERTARSMGMRYSGIKPDQIKKAISKTQSLIKQAK